MPDYVRETFAGRGELPLLKAKGGKSAATTVLLGAWLGVLEEPGDGWLKVRAFGREGWVREADTRDDPALKMFFIDVGQGDGVLIETPTRRLLVDGGGNSNLRNYLKKWKYRWLIQAGHRVHIDAAFVSHFDADHFHGLTSIIEDPDFEIGTIYHNGIARFRSRNADRPADLDTDLGRTIDDADGRRAWLVTTFSTLGQAMALRDGGGLMSSFEDFVTAAAVAHGEGRLKGLKRLTSRSAPPDLGHLSVDVLGPVTGPGSGTRLKWFKDSSHTRNGHSLVLKLGWGDRSFLLGGDLNSLSEAHLLAHHGPVPFRVDVAKACHHGSSEFTTEYLEAVKPLLTVISSGDSQNYGHPQPDAVGAIGKHSRGDRPLVFSTELARNATAQRIHYGLINVRSDGEMVIGAQMFEERRRGDVWNSYELNAFPAG